MTEQFAFQEGGRVGRTIYDHKGLILAPTLPVNGACHQFFAGTALSRYKYGGIGGGDVVNQLVDQLHLRIFADDATIFCRSSYATLKLTYFFFLQNGTFDDPGSLAQHQANHIYFFGVALAVSRTADDQPAKKLFFEM